MNDLAIVSTERSFVGGLVSHPSMLAKVRHRVTEFAFLDQAMATHYVILCDLHDSGLPITATSIISELKRRRIFVEMKRGAVIAEAITQACENVAELPLLADDILQAAEHRRLMKLRDRLSEKLEAGEKVDDLREWLIKEAECGRELTSHDQPELVADVLERLATREDQSDRLIASGLPTLDETIGGFRPGQLILIGARPSIGKSALGYQFAQAAAEADHRTLYVSIEMPTDELGARMLAGGSDLHVAEIMTGALDESQRRQVMSQARRFAGKPLLLWEPCAPTVEKLVAMMRREAAAGLKLAVIDYISLIRHRDPKKAHWEKISEITAALKTAAKQIGIPIILLAQLNREAEPKGSDKNKDAAPKRPSLADLKYSGSLEQDSDLVILIHRADRLTAETELIIAKHRNGPLKFVDAVYDGPRFRFTEPEPKRHPEFDDYADFDADALANRKLPYGTYIVRSKS